MVDTVNVDVGTPVLTTTDSAVGDTPVQSDAAELFQALDSGLGTVNRGNGKANFVPTEFVPFPPGRSKFKPYEYIPFHAQSFEFKPYEYKPYKGPGAGNGPGAGDETPPASGDETPPASGDVPAPAPQCAPQPQCVPQPQCDWQEPDWQEPQRQDCDYRADSWWGDRTNRFSGNTWGRY